MFKNSVMMNLKDLNDEIFKSISTIYKNLDISATPVQGRIMLGINNTSRPLYQKDIEEYVSCNKSTLSAILYTMEKNDLIKRNDSELDSRKKVITLTDKARQVIELIEEKNKAFDESLCENITDEEYQAFTLVVEKIKKNLERINENV